MLAETRLHGSRRAPVERALRHHVPKQARERARRDSLAPELLADPAVLTCGHGLRDATNNTHLPLVVLQRQALGRPIPDRRHDQWIDDEELECEEEDESPGHLVEPGRRRSASPPERSERS